MSQVFDALLGTVSAVNIDATVGVRERRFFQSRVPFVFILRAPGAMECFIVALLFLKSRIASSSSVIPQLCFGTLAAERSFPTESSTPLMNCTDSGAENFRAISSASLITTGRGV